MIHCHWDKDRICENNRYCGMCEYQKSINRGYSVSDADIEKLTEDYKRTGKL